MSPDPQPTAGMSPGAGSSQSSDQMMAAIQQMAANQGGGGSTKRPGTWSSSDTAYEDYGPLARPLSEAEYQHGTFRSQNYIAPPTGFTKSVGAMTNEYYNWNQQQRDDFRSQLALIDKTALTASDADIAKIWGDYVQQSADYYAAGQTLSPIDILAKDIATKSTGIGAQKKTETTSDTTQMSRADSDAIFRSAAQSLLGRDPTEAESSKFSQMLLQQEAQNPSQATITTSYDAQGNVSDTSRTTTGGFTSAAAQDLARQVAEQSPDYGANAANNYMHALLSLVGVK